MSNQEMVREFHEKFGLPFNDEPCWVHREVANLRDSLIEEEAMETCLELRGGRNDVTKLAKELADLAYVVYGTAVTFGIDLDEAIRAVHLSNMSKLGEDGEPIVREDGKILKGPNYFEPNMERVVYGTASE